MLVSRVRELDAERADVGLVEHRQYEIQVHVENMRPIPVAPATMKTDAVARNTFHRLVDRRNVRLDGRHKLRVGKIPDKTSRDPSPDRVNQSAPGSRPHESPCIRCAIPLRAPSSTTPESRNSHSTSWLKRCRAKAQS